MDAPLVIVEEAFVTRGSGVLVAPRITIQDAATAPFRVRLRRPDGSETRATAAFETAHIRGPGGAFAMVRLMGLEPKDVPAGTEVWREPGEGTT